MDLFSAYELYDEFTLHDASYLLCEREPLPPEFPPRDDPHAIIRHRANTLANQLVNDARAGKLRATYRKSDVLQLIGPPEWIVKRNDLKDWVKRKMIRPTFLFPQLPPLDTVRNVATADAYRVGTQSQIFTLEYRRALLRIAQQINNGQVVAYVPDSDNEFAKLQGDDAWALQMRSFLTLGVKSDEHAQDDSRNYQLGERTAANLVSTTMGWIERIHIPTGVASAAKSSEEPEKVTRAKSRLDEAKQDGGTWRDILTPAIDKAICNAESEELQAVYLQLRELALNCEPPFTGLFEGNALCYTNSENKPDKLTKTALSRRLKRRAAKGQ